MIPQDNIKDIMSKQLSEKEVMIYLLVENGMAYRDVAALPFGISHETARTIYEAAKEKFDAQADAGLFTTAVTDAQLSTVS